MKNNIDSINRLDDQGYKYKSLSLWQKQSFGDLSFYNLFRYADVLRQCGKYEASEKMFKSIKYSKLKKEQKAIYFLHFAHLYMEQGKWIKALDKLKKCIKYEYNSTVPYVYISSILIKLEMLDEAIDILKSALNFEGDIDEVSYNLSNCYAIKGLYKESLFYIEKCLSIDHDFPNAQKHREDVILCISSLDNECPAGEGSF